MLDADQLTWADEIVDALYALAGVNPECPPSVLVLSIKLLETAPRREAILNEGEIGLFEGRWQITLRGDLLIAREPVVIGHELTHYWFDHRGETSPPFIEELCDAVGARLAAPAIPFRHALKAYGHRVHALAKAFHTTQTVSLLRIAELEGRPSMVDRGTKPRIVRGAAFDWPEDPRTLPRTKAHPVKVDDRMGMMAVA